RIGNWGLNLIVNVLFGTRYTDLCYGYNAFWTHCLQVLELESGDAADAMHWGDGFEIETVINTRIAKARLDIREVASFEHERLHGVSNLNAVTDGLRVLKAIAIERVTRSAKVAVVPSNVVAIRQRLAA
ncbi:MAG: glycosyl transferase family 2, partial [Frankiales bacterium]|nr:glycosyl transferase family 2 [Frankiales bacterium]